MGIKHLNKFFRETCSNDAIRLTSLNELRGKKIVVDTSIYLYRYHEDGSLIENMFLMISIFKQYNITPIFVFDGKSPTEKKELVEKRCKHKVSSYNEYKELKTFLQEHKNELTLDEKQELISSMDSLKKQFIYLNKDVLEQVKRLITAFGITYYQAQGEADVLCAALVIQKKAWACLSEDMDMFVYGTTRVLRYFSLQNHNVVVYHLDRILSELGISQKELREICVLSGTDYLKMGLGVSDGEDIKKIHLYSVLKWFKKYRKQQNQNQDKNKNNKTLYDFVIENEYIPEDDIGKLMQVDKIFASSMFIKGDSISSHAYIHHSKHTNAEIIKEILEDNGFLFGP